MKAKSSVQIRAPRPRISVTDDHMDRGIQQSSSHCMIQLAIEEQIPSATHILIDLQTIRWSDKKKGLRYTWFTPNIAMSALIKWDYGERPAPFSFLLRSAHITSMRRRPGRASDKRSTHRAVHRLGRKRTVVESGEEGKRPTIIGGRPIRTGDFGKQRVFGRRGLSISGRHAYEILKEQAAKIKRA